MSCANECDLCGALFASAKGVVHVNQILVGTGDKDGTSHSWEGVDFCVACSAKLLALIGPALSELNELMRKPKAELERE